MFDSKNQGNGEMLEKAVILIILKQLLLQGHQMRSKDFAHLPVQISLD